MNFKSRVNLPEDELSDRILIGVLFLFDDFDDVSLNCLSFSGVNGENDSCG